MTTDSPLGFLLVLNKTLLLESSVRKHTDSTFVFSYKDSWQSLLSSQLRQSLNNGDEPRKHLPALQTQPRTWNSIWFLFSSLCMSKALLILHHFFLSFSPFTGFAFRFVQNPQQDTMLFPLTRAWLTKGKVVKRFVLGLFWVFMWGEAGRKNRECQEGAGNWGRAASSQLLSRSNYIFKTLT